jgi:hypothetical protein
VIQCQPKRPASPEQLVIFLGISAKSRKAVLAQADHHQARARQYLKSAPGGQPPNAYWALRLAIGVNKRVLQLLLKRNLYCGVVLDSECANADMDHSGFLGMGNPSETCWFLTPHIPTVADFHGLPSVPERYLGLPAVSASA